MTEAVPTFAQEAYAVLYGRFAGESFRSDYLSWFISKAMVKKTLHALERAEWIRRVAKGEYACIRPDEVFRSMVEFRVPALLRGSALRFAYTGASAVEIWTDYAYIQRSWEHSPYYVKVLSGDVDTWIAFLRRRKVKTFVGEAGAALGEFVVLRPESRLSPVEHEGVPVDALDEVVKYCEAHLDSFEYPLAYLKAKFGAKTRVRIDRRVMEEAAKAV